MFVKDGDFSRLTQLLSPVEFTRLKPLVLLLGWPYCYSCENAKNLLDALWNPAVSLVVFFQLSVLTLFYVHTSPMEGIFFYKNPPPHPTPLKLELNSIHFFKCFRSLRHPTPRNFLSFLWGEYGHFLELHNAHNFQNLQSF